MISGNLTLDDLRKMPLPPEASFASAPFTLVAWDWITFEMATGNPDHHSGLLRPNEVAIGTVDRSDICSITLATPHSPTNMAIWGYDQLGEDGGAFDVHSPIAGFAYISGDPNCPFDVTPAESATTITFSDLTFPPTVRLLAFQVGWRLDEPIDDAPLIGASWATYVN